jgi:RimJ/RimL family protein N-acetyltransferase
LKIRELCVEDAGFVLALTNEASFIENIGDKGLSSVAEAENYILKGPWTHLQPAGYGQFAVELKDDGCLVGVCGVLFREAFDLTDVGFAFMPEFWGRGLAFEAAEAVMIYALASLGVGRISGLTSSENTASIRLLEKLGMQFEKIIKMSDDDLGTFVYSCPRGNQ